MSHLAHRVLHAGCLLQDRHNLVVPHAAERQTDGTQGLNVFRDPGVVHPRDLAAAVRAVQGEQGSQHILGSRSRKAATVINLVLAAVLAAPLHRLDAVFPDDRKRDASGSFRLQSRHIQSSVTLSPACR